MWETVKIAGRPAEVYTPLGRPRFVLLFLAELDGATPRDKPAWTDLFAANHLACVCPAGADTWWLDRVWPPFDPDRSAEAYLLEDVIPVALTRFELRPTAVALAGVGAGGQGALRVGFRHPARARVVAGLGSSLDLQEAYGHGTALDEMFASREQCRQATAVLQVKAHDWPPHIWFACDPDSPWLRGNDRLHEKLAAIGVPHTTDLTTPACGHSWAYYDRLAPALVRFVVGGLETEARRLV